MNIRIHARLLAVMLSLCALPASPHLYAAENEDLASQWQAECKRVQNLPHPNTKPLTGDSGGKPEYCPAEDQYYTLKANPKATQADWDGVRACASSAHNYDILAMMYFNGFGVKRDYDRALYYACEAYRPESSSDPASAAIMEAMLSGQDPGSRELDTCDFAAVQLEINYCSGWREAGQEIQYNNRLDAIGQSMSPAQKTAFEQLRQAVSGYAAACGNEVSEENRGGSGMISFTIDARNAERDQFLADLQQSEAGDFPRYTQNDFAAFDQTLNQVYRERLRAAPSEIDPSALDGLEAKDTLRAAERAWLTYRDAWVAFARARYPKVPAYAWKARLTERRVKNLQDAQQ